MAKNPSAAQNLNNVFFGLGAFLIPMLVVTLLRGLGFKITVSLIAVIMLLSLIPALATTYPPLSPSQCAQSLWGSAFGIIFAIGLLGASIIPAAIGIYSKGKTIQSSVSIALVTAIVLFASSVTLWRLSLPALR